MSYNLFKEVSVSNPGSSTRYGSDDLLEIMKIFNAKVVSGRRVEITNPWRWSSFQEIKQIAEANVPTPTDANTVNFFLSATDNKVKVKKTGGTTVNLEDIGSGTWSNTSTETFSNKTINLDTNILKDSTTNAVGDIIRYDGTRYSRLSKGSANQVLRVNPAGTDLEYATPTGGGGGGEGEANTASNIGQAGIGWFSQKIGVDLQFKNIFSPDSSIDISDDTSNAKIDVTVGTNVAKTSATNTFGDFNNTFRSGRLAVTNPANTFGYFFVGSALTASRNVTLPLLSANDTLVMEAFAQTLTNKTLGSGTIANTDTISLKHSTTNNVGDILKNTGSKYDRMARGGADTFLKVNASGTDLEWGTPSGFGGVKLPDGTIAATTGRWGAFYGGAANGFGMMGFAPSYGRLHGSTNSASESVTNIYTPTTTSSIAEFKTGAGFRRDSSCVFKVKWQLLSTAGGRFKIGLSSATALPAGGSGAIQTDYDDTQFGGGHLEFDLGVSRMGIRYDSGASGLGRAVTEVVVKFRKYGSPSGNATVGIRKASDGSLVTLGTFAPNSFGTGEQTTTINGSSNTYAMVVGDRVTVEFPSNATNGLELDQGDPGNPEPNYTSQDYDGSWDSTPQDTPIAITIKSSPIGGGNGNTPLNNANGIMVHGTIGTHTNYRIARNNGGTTQTEEDSTKALANTNTHTATIDINSTNCVVTIDGTAFTYTTVIPSTTTAMAWYMHVETETNSERGLGIIYSQVVMTS